MPNCALPQVPERRPGAHTHGVGSPLPWINRCHSPDWRLAFADVRPVSLALVGFPLTLTAFDNLRQLGLGRCLEALHRPGLPERGRWAAGWASALAGMGRLSRDGPEGSASRGQA